MSNEKHFNENHFFDELILMYLYKKDFISTNDIEKLFGGDKDFQNVNNVISNRNNTTSYLNNSVGYIEYDKEKNILKITDKGKKYIQEKFKKQR